MRAAILVVSLSSTALADPLSADDARPVVKGAITRVTEGKTVTVGGAQVKFVRSSHKSDGELGMWSFELTRNGAKQELELRSADTKFEAEVDGKGVLLVFRHVDYTTFDIVLAAAKTPKPLDEDACRAKVDKLVEKRKLDVPNGSGMSEEQGFVTVSTTAWVGHCGTYTQRLWLTKPIEKPRKGKP